MAMPLVLLSLMSCNIGGRKPSVPSRCFAAAFLLVLLAHGRSAIASPGWKLRRLVSKQRGVRMSQAEGFQAAGRSRMVPRGLNERAEEEEDNQLNMMEEGSESSSNLLDGVGRRKTVENPRLSESTKRPRRSDIREFYVDIDTRRIRDRFHRERVFHGLNVVVKGPPWHPTTERFDARMSLVDADVALIQGWGLNIVRLGMMWPGVEPQRGVFNRTYIKVMKGIVAKLAAAGILTIIEFHQDLFSAHFCGEGVPDWLIEDAIQKSDDSHRDQRIDGKRGPSSLQEDLSDPPPYVRTFPEPLGRRYFSPGDRARALFREGGDEPSSEQCTRHEWFNYHFTYAVSRAFQDLYDNRQMAHAHKHCLQLARMKSLS